MVSPDIRYTQCSGDDSSMESKCDCPWQSEYFDSLRGAPPCNVAIITCVDKTEPPPICHPDRVKRAEGSTQVACFTLRRLLLQLEWIPPLRLRYGRNDRRFRFGCYKFECTTNGLTANGGRLPPLHCVVPFTPTGCIRNVAGGRLPPLHLMYHVFCILRTQNRHRMRKYTPDSLQNCQLSIVHCQLEHPSSSTAPV